MERLFSDYTSFKAGQYVWQLDLERVQELGIEGVWLGNAVTNGLGTEAHFGGGEGGQFSKRLCDSQIAMVTQPTIFNLAASALTLHNATVV